MSALYDGPIDTVEYGYEPIILEKIPNLTDGDAQVAPVTVSAGAQVVDAAGNLVSLTTGTKIRPSGCRADNCAITYDGSSSIQMDQMIVTFTMLESAATSPYDYDPAKAGETSRQFKAVVPFTLNPSSYAPVPNLLLRNDGGRFRDVSEATGVEINGSAWAEGARADARSVANAQFTLAPEDAAIAVTANASVTSTASNAVVITGIVDPSLSNAEGVDPVDVFAQYASSYHSAGASASSSCAARRSRPSAARPSPRRASHPAATSRSTGSKGRRRASARRSSTSSRPLPPILVSK